MTALARRGPGILLATAIAWSTCGAGGKAAPPADVTPPPLPPVKVVAPRPPAPPHPSVAALVAAARATVGRDASADSRGVVLYWVDVDYPEAIETGQIFEAFNLSHGRRLSRCYELIARDRPTPRGRVQLNVTVGKNGHVATAKLESSFDERLDDCIVNRVRGWSFPSLKANDGARLTLEIGFSSPRSTGPGGADAAPARAKRASRQR